MKKDIHPEAHTITVQCACGKAHPIKSTQSDIKLTLCSACHPFYTGQQKYVDTAGRIEKFHRRFGKKSGDTKKKSK